MPVDIASQGMPCYRPISMRLFGNQMNNPAASSGVSKPKTTAKVYAPRGGELDPKRLN